MKPTPFQKNVVNVEGYLGRWYDIAHTRSFFQPPGGFNTTATYTLNSNNSIKVFNNTYYVKDNKIYNFNVVGNAQPLNQRGDNYKLSFQPSSTGLPTNPDNPIISKPSPSMEESTSCYNIVHLVYDDSRNYDVEYVYSLVTGCGKDALYLLSRTPYPPKEHIMSLLSWAKNNGYNTDVDFTPHYL